MGLLLLLLKRRLVIAIAALLSLVWAWGRWGDYARNQTDFMLHPPAATSSPLSADIEKNAEARESGKLHALHRAVSAEIAAAAASGFQIEKIQRLADTALDLDTPAQRPTAIERLNKLRLAIPRKKEAFQPASGGDP